MRTAAVVGLALLFGGCADGGGATEQQAILDDDRPYILLDDPAWELIEGVDYPADHPMATIAQGIQPPTDWFVEYDHEPIDLPGGAIQVDHVTISAVDAPLEETAAQFDRLRITTEPVAGGRWRALQGTSTDDSVAPMVLVDGGEQTVVVIGSDLDVDGLVGLVERLEPTTEADWLAAVGEPES